MKWHAVWSGVLAAYLTLIASAVWTDVLGQRGAGIMVAIGAAAQAGTTAYYAAVQRTTVPAEPREQSRL